MGSYHPNHRDIYYPVNYGYIKDIMSPDGEVQVAFQEQYFSYEIIT